MTLFYFIAIVSTNCLVDCFAIFIDDCFTIVSTVVFEFDKCVKLYVWDSCVAILDELGAE